MLIAKKVPKILLLIQAVSTLTVNSSMEMNIFWKIFLNLFQHKIQLKFYWARRKSLETVSEITHSFLIDNSSEK